MTTIYRHTQVSRATLVGMGIAWAAVAWWSVRVSDPMLVIIGAFIALVLLVFSTLTVTVRDGVLGLFFGLGLIRRRILLSRIRDVRVVRSPWYYGWGIRLIPTGWLWNVSGLDGVEVQFEDGHRFRVGSDEADRLAEALRREMAAVDRARG
jgi:hypothetical protein